MSSRSLHRWLTLIVALPFGIVLLSGLLLQTRSFNTWLQSKPLPVEPGPITMTFDQMLSRLRSVPQARIDSWADVKQIDVRPDKGHIRIRSKHDFMEVQLSPSGDVVQVAPRRTSWLIEIHDGAFFGDAVKWWIFIPSSLALLVMYFTGLWLFIKPWVKARSAKRSSEYVSQGFSLRS